MTQRDDRRAISIFDYVLEPLWIKGAQLPTRDSRKSEGLLDQLCASPRLAEPPCPLPNPLASSAVRG